MNVWEMTSAGESFQAQHRPSDVYWTRQQFQPQRTSFDMKSGSSLHRCLHLICICLWNLLCPILNHTYGCYKHDAGVVSGYRCRDWLGLRAVWGVVRTGLVGGGSIGVAMRLAFGRLGIWWAPVRCLVLVGGVALGLNLGGNPAWKNHFHMGQAVWLLQTSRGGGVGSILLSTCVYEERCLFINYLKWTAGTPSVWL